MSYIYMKKQSGVVFTGYIYSWIGLHTNVRRQSQQGSTPLGTANEKLDIVQFASAIFVAEEGQDLIDLGRGRKWLIGLLISYMV